MNWPGFSALSAAWLFLLLPPLILFYFLKLRRPRQEVPSLALWRQVISDQRVNSPFQKFKRNLLLLLQILLLCALILAAMQPYWPAGHQTAQSIPVLIDVSASMGALDRASGRSRLDLAQEQVQRLIDNLLPNQQLSLIAVDSTARRLTDFTSNQQVLQEALNRLNVRPVPSRLDDGLRMAQALARTAPVETVVLVSDGNVPAQIDFQLPFHLNYQKVTATGANVGITEFNARRNSTGWDVFVRLEAADNSTEPAPAAAGGDDTAGPTEQVAAGQLAEVGLYENGVSIRQESVRITPGKTARVAFSLDAPSAASLEVRVKADGFDALADDNQAFLELPAPRALKVFCPPELSAFRHALVTQPQLDLYPRDGATTPAAVDLRFSAEPVLGLPASHVTLFTGVIPSELAALVQLETSLVNVTDWNRTAPLLRYVQLLDVQIADNPVSQAGISDRDYELAGFDILAQGARGPLIVSRETPTGNEFYLLFHTDRSSLPYRVGFPILIANAVQIATDRAQIGEAQAWPTGTLPPQQLEANTEYHIVTPDGGTESGKSSSNGVLSGVTANQPGRYQILEGETPVTALGVGLLAPQESELGAVDKLMFPESAIASSADALKTDRPLWTWFAWAGLLLLLGEWWYFQRRPGGVPR